MWNTDLFRALGLAISKKRQPSHSVRPVSSQMQIGSTGKVRAPCPVAEPPILGGLVEDFSFIRNVNANISSNIIFGGPKWE